MTLPINVKRYVHNWTSKLQFLGRKNLGVGSQKIPLDVRGLTLEGTRRVKLTPPSIFLALNFCSLTDYKKLWHNCSLFVKISFDPKLSDVTINDVIIISHATCVLTTKMQFFTNFHLNTDNFTTYNGSYNFVDSDR